jgi:hypothetical protein
MRATALLLCLLAGSAAAAPTRIVGGQRIAVLDAEPAFDEGTFIAPARSSLAETYRAKLVARALDGEQLPAKGLFVVRIRRDTSGKRYLYKPCDQSHHQRTLIMDTQVWMLGTEPLVVPIAKKQQRGKLTTIELETKDLPPMVATKLRLRATGTAGVYELAANDDGFTELVATPAAAAKLDVVVRVCKKAKVSELDFTTPSSR